MPNLRNLIGVALSISISINSNSTKYKPKIDMIQYPLIKSKEQQHLDGEMEIDRAIYIDIPAGRVRRARERRRF